MRAGFGSEGSVVVRDCERGEGEREEVGAHFCELFSPLPPLLFFYWGRGRCFAFGCGWKLGWIADLPRGAKAVGLTRTGMSRIG